MKKIITLLCLISIFIHSIAFAKWDKTDKTLFGTFTYIMIIDCSQTNYIFTHEKRYEKNPIMRSGVKRIGRGFIPIYFSGCIFGSWYISNKLKSRNRKILLSALILFESAIIIRNNGRGVGLNFKF